MIDFAYDVDKPLPFNISTLLNESRKCKGLVGTQLNEYKDVNELQYCHDEQVGLSNGTYLITPSSSPKKFSFQSPPIVGIEFYRNDCVIVRQGFKRKADWQLPIRGEIREFSTHSRQRMAFISGNTPIEHNSMITLTMPRHAPKNGKVAKWQFAWFMKELKRKFGKLIQWLWFMEFQGRNAVHFHILTDIKMDDFGGFTGFKRKGGKQKYITVPLLHDWVSETWCKIVHTPLRLYKDKRGNIYNKEGEGREFLTEWRPDLDPKRVADNLRVGSSWERIRDKNGARHYAVKYAMKLKQKVVPPDFSDVGRFWGCSKGVKDFRAVHKFVAVEPMIKSVLAELPCHEAIKGLKKYPKILFNVASDCRNEIDTVKYSLIPLKEFRGNLIGFNKPVELREVSSSHITVVFRRVGFDHAYGEWLKQQVGYGEIEGVDSGGAGGLSEDYDMYLDCDMSTTVEDVMDSMRTDMIIRLVRQGCDIETIAGVINLPILGDEHG